MLGSTTTHVEIYTATLGAVGGTFEMNVNETIHKPQPLNLDNPNYPMLLSKYSHLEGVSIRDDEARPQFPIHVVLEQANTPQSKHLTHETWENLANL